MKTKVFDEIVEVYHRQISALMSELIKSATTNEDGSVTIPQESVDAFVALPDMEIGDVSKEVAMHYGSFATEIIEYIVGIRSNYVHYDRPGMHWIQWSGNECPVEDGVVVEAILKGGDIVRSIGKDLQWGTSQGNGIPEEYKIGQYAVIGGDLI